MKFTRHYTVRWRDHDDEEHANEYTSVRAAFKAYSTLRRSGTPSASVWEVTRLA